MRPFVVPGIGEIGAMINTALLREWCLVKDTPGAGSKGWRWLENADKGPSTQSVERLLDLQAVHGEMNVATGNANPISPGRIGFYLREPA